MAMEYGIDEHEQVTVDFLKANTTLKFKDLSAYQKAVLKKVGKHNCEFFNRVTGLWQTPKLVNENGLASWDVKQFYWNNIYRIKANYERIE